LYFSTLEIRLLTAIFEKVQNLTDPKRRKKMKFQPLADRIIVEPLEAEEKSAGGILIPDTAKEKPQQGKVLAVGKGKVLDNGQVATPEVKVGDVVLYGKYSGTEIKDKDGSSIFIIREDEVLAIVK
jgi:chaperonin GroES